VEGCHPALLVGVGVEGSVSAGVASRVDGARSARGSEEVDGEWIRIDLARLKRLAAEQGVEAELREHFMGIAWNSF